jgi:tetrahydromethanopterin S-methyltransferase subunit B
MPSMQEALTDALEHPLAEPRRPARQKRPGRKSASHREGASDGMLWGLIGSAVGSLLVGIILARARR